MTQQSANSPQEVRPRPTIADDAQRSRERVSAGQTVFSGFSRRCRGGVTPSSQHRVRKKFSGMGSLGLFENAISGQWCYQLGRSVT